MTPGKAIFTKITSSASINALISNRCYQVRLPERTSMPAVRIQKISDVPFKDNDGSTMWSARIQVDTYATDHASAQRIATLIMNELDVIRQTTVNHVSIVECTLENEIDDVDDYAEYNGLFRVTQDFRVTYLRMIS